MDENAKMIPLEHEDVLWIARRLPKYVLNAMKRNPGKVFLAGGFIRACIAREEVNDIDLFVGSAQEAKELACGLALETQQKVIETDNAFTVTTPLSVQVIHRWTFNTPDQCIESFDFTIACAAIWFDPQPEKEAAPILRGLCDIRFYIDLAAKRIVYRSPVRNEEAGGSMLRVLKFYQRGYRIPLSSLGAVIARLMSGVRAEGVDMTERVRGMTPEQANAFVITGMLREVDPAIDPSHEVH